MSEFQQLEAERIVAEVKALLAPPALFFLVLSIMLLAYLLAVEGMKRWFFRRFAVE